MRRRDVTTIIIIVRRRLRRAGEVTEDIGADDRGKRLIPEDPPQGKNASGGFSVIFGFELKMRRKLVLSAFLLYITLNQGEKNAARQGLYEGTARG